MVRVRRVFVVQLKRNGVRVPFCATHQRTSPRSALFFVRLSFPLSHQLSARFSIHHPSTSLHRSNWTVEVFEQKYPSMDGFFCAELQASGKKAVRFANAIYIVVSPNDNNTKYDHPKQKRAPGKQIKRLTNESNMKTNKTNLKKLKFRFFRARVRMHIGLNGSDRMRKWAEDNSEQAYNVNKAIRYICAVLMKS